MTHERHHIRRIRPLPALIAAACLVAMPAAAQDLSFQVNNGLTPQEISVIQNSQQSSESSTGAVAGTDPSSSNIGQYGEQNSAMNLITGSSGAMAQALQVGYGNTSRAAIIDSPGSGISQFQLGNDNSSFVTILRGQDNAISVGQIGNNLGMELGLVDSIGTKVVYGQVGNGYLGSITIRNAPAGTVVKLK